MNSNAKRDAAAKTICINPEFDTEDQLMSDVLQENRIWGFTSGYDFRDAEVAELMEQLAYYKNGTQIKEVHYDEMYAVENAALKQQVEQLKAFIIKWLEFEESCIKKDGPYVSQKIPNLMNEANTLLGREG